MITLNKVVAFSLLVIAALFAGCTNPGKPEGTFSPAEGGKQYGGIYRVNENGELSLLDPVRINDVTSGHAASNIYDKLITFDADLNLQPQIANSWDVSEDGRTFTYHLRSDVYFHNNACFPDGKGRLMTASDVKYSFSRVVDFRTGTKNASYFIGKVEGASEYFEATRASFEDKSDPAVPEVTGFRAVDDTTFVVQLVEAFAPFENYVALTSMGIHPREAVEMYGEDFMQNPVGTGPFVFVKWTPDRSLNLKRNDRYWKYDEFGNQLPFLEGVRVSFIKDDKLQLLEFAAGKLEESYRIPNEFFGDIVDENRNPKGKYAEFALLEVPALSTQYYGFLQTDEVFDDRRVRQAFNKAVDRRRIIAYVLRGQAAGPAEHGLVPSSMPGYDHDSVVGYTFDPDGARQLLTEAGYPNGEGFPEVTLQLNSGGGRNVQIAEAVQGMLMETLGITVNMLQVEFAQHLEKIDGGQAPFFRLGWVADYPDPETFLQLYYGKLVPKNGGISPINSCRFTNAVYDSLYEKAIVTNDRSARMQLYREAEQVAINEAPMLLLIHDDDYRFLQTYVRDYQNNAMDRLLLHGVWFDL